MNKWKASFWALFLVFLMTVFFLIRNQSEQAINIVNASIYRSKINKDLKVISELLQQESLYRSNQWTDSVSLETDTQILSETIVILKKGNIIGIHQK